VSECNSAKILLRLGYAYNYYNVSSELKEPKYSNFAIRDLINCSNCKDDFCNNKLYQHQYETFQALQQGKNVILTAQTGSGKTEAWLIYAIKRFQQNSNFRVLVIYPTKALANDQTYRIARYLSCLGFNIDVKGNDIFYGDLVRYDGDTSRVTEVKNSLQNAKIITTNPDMFIRNFKVFGVPNLVVIDELDFYDSGKATTLIEILRNLYPSSQFVIISGTLSNPNDLANSLNAKIITGSSPKPDNYYYIVIGKEADVKNAYEIIKDVLPGNYGIRSYEEFKKRIFEVYFRSAVNNDAIVKGEIYKVFLNSKADIKKILSEFKKCQGELTIAFFKSINEAEVYGNSLKVPTHHSKKSKKERSKIERDMRDGKLPLVFTVKTLLQGIDIGNAVRVVHIGLPLLVRDFIQREGRKGRRANIKYTESIIIPMGFDPRLADGFNTLKGWLDLGAEALIYNPDNLLVKVYDLIIRLKKNPALHLSRGDERLLSYMGLMDSNTKKVNMKKLRYFGFYNIKSARDTLYLFKGSKPIVVERIPRKDLVEYFQIGSIDPVNKAIVNEIRIKKKGKKQGNKFFMCFNVYEVPFTDHKQRLNKCIKEAIDDYNYHTQNKWGITPNFSLDLELGKIVSKVVTDIFFNDEGFVEYVERPVGVNWYIESRVPIKEKRKTPTGVEIEVVDYKYHVIRLECRSYGSYRDVTYAYLYEVNEDTRKVDEGMTFLVTALRICYGIRPDLIAWYHAGNLLKVWETTPVGILERIRRGDLVINNKRLDLETFSNCIKGIDINDQRFKVVFYSLFPVRGVDFDVARQTAIELAIKLFKYSKILGSLQPSAITNSIVVDHLKVNNIEYYAITYSNEQSRTITEVLHDENSLNNRLAQVFSEAKNVNEIIVNTDKGVNTITNMFLKELKVKVVDIREESRKKLGYELSPADVSLDVSKDLLKLNNPDTRFNEDFIKRLFRKRAEVIQGIRNYLKG